MSDLDKQGLIAAVGPERYLAAGQVLQKAARSFGVPDGEYHGSPPIDWGLLEEIEDLIMGPVPSERGKRANQDTMALLLDIYKDLPSYALLYVIGLHWFDFRQAAHELFWKAARDILDGEDEALARPLEYELGVDFFEDARLEDEAWTELARDGPTQRRAYYLLNTSRGASPSIRERLYTRLIGDPAYHAAILHSMVVNKEAYHEPADKERAARVLQQLFVPTDSPDLQEMRAFLQVS